jgi:hypothetical protein
MQEDRCVVAGGRPLLVGVKEWRGRADLEACVVRSFIIECSCAGLLLLQKQQGPPSPRTEAVGIGAHPQPAPPPPCTTARFEASARDRRPKRKIPGAGKNGAGLGARWIFGLTTYFLRSGLTCGCDWSCS